MAQRLQEPMADEDEQAMVREPSTDFPTASTPDQSNIPHHGAVDPSAPDPEQEPAES